MKMHKERKAILLLMKHLIECHHQTLHHLPTTVITRFCTRHNLTREEYWEFLKEIETYE